MTEGEYVWSLDVFTTLKLWNMTSQKGIHDGKLITLVRVQLHACDLPRKGSTYSHVAADREDFQEIPTQYPCGSSTTLQHCRTQHRQSHLRYSFGSVLGAKTDLIASNIAAPKSAPVGPVADFFCAEGGNHWTMNLLNLREIVGALAVAAAFILCHILE